MRAAPLMFASVLAYSIFPVVGALIVAEYPPLIFVAKSFLHAFFGACAAILVVAIVTRRRSLRTAFEGFGRLDLWGLSLARGSTNVLSHACLFGSFHFLNKAAATTIYEVWPVIAVVLIPMLVRRHFAPLSLSDGFYGIIALLGVVLLVNANADTGSSEAMAAITSDNGVTAGIALAAASSLLMALSSSLGVKVTERWHPDPRVIAPILCAQLPMRLAGVAVALAASEAFGEVHDLSFWTLDLATFNGVLINLFGSIAFVLANREARKATINLMWYMTPVLALGWLHLFGLAVVTGTIVFGAILIISANLLTNLRVDPSLAYSATLVSIALSAVVSFFIDTVGPVDYFSALSVPATIFAILVAFLLERSFRKRTQQEERALEVLENLPPDTARAAARTMMSTLVMSDTDKAMRVLNDIEKEISSIAPRAHRAWLRFTLARGSAIAFGEITILWVVGFATVLLAHLRNPESFMADLLAMVLTAAVTFFCFALSDEKNWQALRVLSGYYRHKFGEDPPIEGPPAFPSFSSLLSLALIFLTIAVYAVFLADQHGMSLLVNF